MLWPFVAPGVKPFRRLEQMRPGVTAARSQGPCPTSTPASSCLNRSRTRMAVLVRFGAGALVLTCELLCRPGCKSLSFRLSEFGVGVVLA